MQSIGPNLQKNKEMASEHPTAVLIVHGAYFLPLAWNDFSTRLTNTGLTVRVPRLPTCNDTVPPTALLEQDLHAVRTAAKELIDTNHKIIVLAHSYGGIVASNAITPDLYSAGGSGVVSLIYLAAFVLPLGDGLGELVARHGMQSEVDLGDLGDGVMFPKNAPESFYNDIERERAEKLAKENVTHNYMAAVEKTKYAPWRDLPTTYVFCSRDKAILPPLQEALLKDVVDVGGSGIVTESIEAGHCPFLSRPGDVQRIVEGAVAKIEENRGSCI